MADMAAVATRLPWLSAAGRADRVDGAMRPLALHLMRRAALYALVAAALLIVVPRALVEMGVLGEDATAAVERSARALDAARSYGATADMPTLREAERQLQSARELVARGEKREARRAAAAARASAVEAQRTALVAQQEQHRQAEAIVEDVDKRLNELEASYTVITTGLDKAAVAPLFSLMKTARAAGGGLALAYEQGDYAKVLREQPAAIEVIEATRTTLRSSKR
jgi:hypothetical protein